MSQLFALADRLWCDGAGPDDRRPLAHVVEQLADSTGALGELRDELAAVLALVECAAGTPAAVAPVPAGAPIRRTVLAAIAATWSAALVRDQARLDRALGVLDRALAGLSDGEPGVDTARGWADLAIAEAALAAGNRPIARRRLETVAKGDAPVPLRVAASLRIATLLVERADLGRSAARCRQAATLAGEHRPLLAQQARITGALVDYMAGDRARAEAVLQREADAGELGLLPRILLASLAAPERAMMLLARGLEDASKRNDAFAFAMCGLVGARRYAALERDADALLTLTAAMLQLQPTAPTYAEVLDDERRSLRAAWGDSRYTAAEAAAIALLDQGARA